MTTLYYCSPDLRITIDEIVSRRPIDQRFAIADLQCLHITGPVRANVQVGTCSTGLSGACTVLATVDDVILANHTLASVGIVATAVLAAAIAGAWWSARRLPVQLRAIHRGRAVCVYETNDRLILGQVTRALRRVFEDRSGDAGSLA